MKSKNKQLYNLPFKGSCKKKKVGRPRTKKRKNRYCGYCGKMYSTIQAFSNHVK